MTIDNQNSERIAKRMARAGLCSRRDAEKWIESGRVSVNGKTLTSPGVKVSDTDKILVDGKPIKEKEQTRLFLYHKPAGLVTTHKDEKGRATIFGSLPSFMPRVVSIGRLDLNTEGLLLLTNDGELARYLELPATGWKRKYRVRVHGLVDEKRLEHLKKGIKIDGVHYKSIDAVLEKQTAPTNKTGKTNSWITVTLTEGKNREIRKVMDALGLKVNRLIRVSYGPFMLGKLPPQGIEEIKTKIMKDQIKGYFSAKNQKRTMRIISGIYGGRKLDTPKTGDIRPTSDKIRGAIFNALQSRMDLDGARVLDICCGTGALGLESISRGAAHCTFFDKSKKSLELAQQNAKALGAQNCCTFLNQPIENIKKMQPNFAAADLFFADPPYHLNLLQKLLETLPATGWIKAGSLGIVECEKNLALPAPQHFEIVNEKIYGETKIIFLNHRPATEY